MGLANVHGDWVRGAHIWYQTHRKRIVDAVGSDVVKYIEDFVRLPVDNTTGDPTEWTMTVVETGTGNSTFTQTDASGGAGLITTDDADNDGVNAQLVGESFKFASTNTLYFGAFGVTISNAIQSDVFLGLAVTDTDILGGVTDSVGFRAVDASADLNFVVETGSTETESAGIHTLADATPVDMEFYWDGTGLEVFVDGASVATPAVTNLPSTELRVSWHFLNGLADAPQTCQVDKLVCIQIGR